MLKTHNTTASDEGLACRLWDEVLRLAAVDDRIAVVDETLSFATVMALTASADFLVSLHRAEGLAFGLLEAMRLGVPVVCTAYSGNLDFCDDETAWLVEADEVAGARVIERYGIEAAGRGYAARIGEILAGRPVPDRGGAPVFPTVVRSPGRYMSR